MARILDWLLLMVLGIVGSVAPLILYVYIHRFIHIKTYLTYSHHQEFGLWPEMDP